MSGEVMADADNVSLYYSRAQFMVLKGLIVYFLGLAFP